MKFSRTKRIRFHHCDPAGIVFYPQYLVLCNELVEDWFEQALGVSFHTLHAKMARGIPMRQLTAEFLAPSIQGEDLCFSLVVEQIGTTSLHLFITAEKEDVIRFKVHQTIVWAALDGIPRRTPIEAEWRARFEPYLDTASASI